MQLFTAKALAIFFGLATVAFTVSTIVLAVQKGELQDDLDEALNELQNLKDPTTTTSTTPGNGSKPTGVTDPSEQTPTDSGNSTNPSNPSEPTKPTQPGPPTSLVTTPSTTTPSDSGFPNPNDIIYRLPTDIRPVKYQLYLYPHLEKGTFEGTINIGLGVNRATNVIALHSKNLDIAGVSLLPVMAKMRIKIKAYYTDPRRELLIIELEEHLQLYLPYTLSVSFRGTLNGLNGFYSSSYIDQDGNQK